MAAKKKTASKKSSKTRATTVSRKSSRTATATEGQSPRKVLKDEPVVNAKQGNVSEENVLVDGEHFDTEVVINAEDLVEVVTNGNEDLLMNGITIEGEVEDAITDNKSKAGKKNKAIVTTVSTSKAGKSIGKVAAEAVKAAKNAASKLVEGIKNGKISLQLKTQDDTDSQEVEESAVSTISEGAFACHVCEKTFTRKYHLDRHMQLTPCSGQPPPSHPCDVCGKVYTRKDNLREHLRVHAGEVTRKKKFQCSHCPKMFHGASLLKIHERTHSGEKPFVCDFCPKAFPSGGALAKHIRIHTGEKPYACPAEGCHVRFSLKGTLNRHMRIHTGIRPHKCPHCEKQFIQIGGLKAHMFYHTGENGFKCEFCDKVFNRKARLQMHTRYVHEKEKPFECPDCSKKFTRKEDLNRHSVLHTGERKFSCQKCDKSFAIRPSLKLHMMTHVKEAPRSCNECGRAFIRKDCLLRHIRKKHRGKLDQILAEEEEEAAAPFAFVTPPEGTPKVLTETKLVEAIKELLTLLVDEPTLESFGWPDAPIDKLLESVIKRCGHNPVDAEQYEYYERLRENSKLLFTVVIDDNAVKSLLNNQTVDEVILHVLKLAK